MDLAITHQISAPRLEVIPADLGSKANQITIAIGVLNVCDQGTLEAGNRLLMESHTTLKELEAARVKLKKPITDLGREIDKVVASVADPLEAGKRSLMGKVGSYQRKLAEAAERIRREAEANAAAERAAAEKERARLQAEADARHAAEVAAAKAKAEAEAKELEEILGKPVEAAPVVVAPAPVIEAPKVAAPVIVAPVVPKAAATTVKVPVLVVTDPAALAAFLVQAGRAELVDFKMREVKAMVDAGVQVAGVTVEMREQHRMARVA